MKNVAATKGHKVRRTDFFLGDTANNDLAWVGAVAVANFYVFLLERLTLTTSSPLCRGSRENRDFPGISAKLVRNCEITVFFHRCKKILNICANFCEGGR